MNDSHFFPADVQDLAGLCTPSVRGCWTVTGMHFWCGAGNWAHVPHWPPLGQFMAPQCKTWPGRRRSQTLPCGGSWQDTKQWAQTEAHDALSAHTLFFIVRVVEHWNSFPRDTQYQLDKAHPACWSWPCSSSRVGLGDLWRPLSALILCFCDYIPLVSFLLPYHSQSI